MARTWEHILPLYFNRNIAMPETYIIDQQGILQNEQIGPFQSLAEVRSSINPLLVGR